MIKKFFTVIFILGTFLFAQQPIQPEFKLKTVDGKTFLVKGAENGLIMPKELQGKVILVEFWGTHCPPCRLSIPQYIDLNKKYKDKIAMFAVEVQMTPKDVLKEFVKQKGINYNILTQSENYDFVNYISVRTKWRGAIPFLLIFDKTGEFKFIKLGYISEKDVEGIIKILLNKNSSTQNNNIKKK